MDFTILFFLFLVISSLQPVIRQRMLEASRARMLRQLEVKRNSRAIALIHRQERLSFLGVSACSLHRHQRLGRDFARHQADQSERAH